VNNKRVKTPVVFLEGFFLFFITLIIEVYMRRGPKGKMVILHDKDGILIHRERVITEQAWRMWSAWKIFKFYKMVFPEEIAVFDDILKSVDTEVFKRITDANVKYVVEYLSQYKGNAIMNEYVEWLLDLAKAKLEEQSNPLPLGNAPEYVEAWRKDDRNQWEMYLKPTVWKNCMKPIYRESLNLERSPRTGDPNEWYTDHTSQSPKVAGEMIEVDWNKYRKINHLPAGNIPSHWEEIDYVFAENGVDAMPIKYLRSDLDYWERSEHLAEQNVNQLTTKEEWNAWIDGKEVDLFEKVQDALSKGLSLEDVLSEYEQYCLEEELFSREGRVEVALQDVDRPYQHENIHVSDVRPAFRKHTSRQLREIEEEQLLREPLGVYAGGFVPDTGYEVQETPF